MPDLEREIIHRIMALERKYESLSVREYAPLNYFQGSPIITPSAPYTSTDWDGDAKTGATGTLDLSSVFGVPAGVKGVFAKFTIKSATTEVAGALGSGSDFPNALFQRTQVANVEVAVAGYVPCDSNGDIRFTQSASLSGVVIEFYAYCL